MERPNESLQHNPRLHRRLEAMLFGTRNGQPDPKAMEVHERAVRNVQNAMTEGGATGCPSSFSGEVMTSIFSILLGKTRFALCGEEQLQDGEEQLQDDEEGSHAFAGDSMEAKGACESFMDCPTVNKLRNIIDFTVLGQKMFPPVKAEPEAGTNPNGRDKSEACPKANPKPAVDPEAKPEQNSTDVKTTKQVKAEQKKPSADANNGPPTRVQIFDVQALNKGSLPVVSRGATAAYRQKATYADDETSALVYCRTETGDSVHLMLAMPMSFFIQVPLEWEKSHVRALATALGAFKFRLENRIRFVYYTPHLPGNNQRDRPQRLPFARFFFRSEDQARNMYWKLSTGNGRRTNDEVWQKLLTKAGLNPGIVRRQKSRHVFSAHDLTDPVRDFFSEVNRRLKLTIEKDNKCSMESWLTLSKVRWLSKSVFFARSKWNAMIDLSNIVGCDNALVSAPMTKVSFDIEQFSALNPKSQARPFPKSWRRTDEIRNISCAIQVGSGPIRNVALCLGATRISQQLDSINKKTEKKEQEKKEQEKKEQEKKEQGEKQEKNVKKPGVEKGGTGLSSTGKLNPEATPRCVRAGARRNGPRKSRRQRSAGPSRSDPGPSRARSLFSQAIAANKPVMSAKAEQGQVDEDDWSHLTFEEETVPGALQAEECAERLAPMTSHLKPLQFSSENANSAKVSDKDTEPVQGTGVPIVGVAESDTKMFGPGGVAQNTDLLRRKEGDEDELLNIKRSSCSRDEDSKTTPFPSSSKPRIQRKPSAGVLDQDLHLSTAVSSKREMLLQDAHNWPQVASSMEQAIENSVHPDWRKFGAAAGAAASSEDEIRDPSILHPASDPGPVTRATKRRPLPLFIEPSASASDVPVPEIVRHEQETREAFAKEHGAPEIVPPMSPSKAQRRESPIASAPTGPIVRPGEKVLVPGTNIEIWAFDREDELLLAFGDLLQEVEVDLLTGYNIINYDEMAVYQRLFLYYLCKVQSWKEVSAMHRAATRKMETYEQIRAQNKRLTKEVRQQIQDLFCLPTNDYEACQNPPLAYLILSQAQSFDKATYDYFSSGPDPLRWFFHGKIPTQQITYREQMYDTSAHGQFMMKQWVGTGYAILCGWVMMKRSTFKFPSYTLKYVLKHFFKDNEDYHKIDLDYEDMFNNMETNDPDRLGENAVYCCRDAEAVLFLIDKMGIEMNMRQNGALMRASVQVQTDSGMQRLVLAMLQGELEKDYIINNFVPRSGDYVGATVIEPLRGFYIDPVATLDYASLYPSIMIAGNIGPSTLIEPRYDGGPCKASKGVRTRTWQVTDTYSTTFVQNPKGKTFFGKIPKMLKRLLGARRAVKKQMKAAFKRGDEFQGSMLNSKQLAIKISCNSVYGFFGVKVGHGFFPINAIAATVTCWGRKIITELTKRRIEEEKGWKCIYGDSVTGDTPIWIRTSECCRLCRFDELHTLLPEGLPYQRKRGKDFIMVPSTLQFETWTESGWTQVRSIIRHDTEKSIVRVVTRTGIVDCTTDHSLVAADGSELRPTECSKGTGLMHTMPPHAMPFERDRSSFNAAGEPVVPSSILNDPNLDAVRAYWTKQDGKNLNKQLASGLWYLAHRLGHRPTLEVQDNGLFSLQLHQGLESGDGTTVREMYTIKPAGVLSTVYDLETDNHHFAVGPGNLVVHNTDSVMVLLKGLNMNEAWAEAIRLSDWVTDEVLKDFPALILEAEKVSKYYLMLKKKNYASLISENPKDVNDLELDYKGIEMKRRDKTKVVKEMLKVLYTMMPKEEDADARPEITGPVISKMIQGWLQKIIDDELDLSYYETSQTSKIKYKKGRPGHMLVFDRHNERVESGIQKGLIWDAGKRVPYVVLLGEKQTKKGLKVVYGSKEVSTRMEEPEWVTTWNSMKKRKRKDRMVLDRVYYIRLCANAVTRLLPFHLPHVDEMFDFAIEQVEMQMFKMQSLGGYFGSKRVMPTGLPRLADSKPVSGLHTGVKTGTDTVTKMKRKEMQPKPKRSKTTDKKKKTGEGKLGKGKAGKGKAGKRKAEDISASFAAMFGKPGAAAGPVKRKLGKDAASEKNKKEKKENKKQNKKKLRASFSVKKPKRRERKTAAKEGSISSFFKCK